LRFLKLQIWYGLFSQKLFKASGQKGGRVLKHLPELAETGEKEDNLLLLRLH
jgi:hypothetical protein